MIVISIELLIACDLDVDCNEEACGRTLIPMCPKRLSADDDRREESECGPIGIVSC